MEENGRFPKLFILQPETKIVRLSTAFKETASLIHSNVNASLVGAGLTVVLLRRNPV